MCLLGLWSALPSVLYNLQFCNTITEKKKAGFSPYALAGIYICFTGYAWKVSLLAFDVNYSWYKCHNLLYSNV